MNGPTENRRKLYLYFEWCSLYVDISSEKNTCPDAKYNSAQYFSTIPKIQKLKETHFHHKLPWLI